MYEWNELVHCVCCWQRQRVRRGRGVSGRAVQARVALTMCKRGHAPFIKTRSTTMSLVHHALNADTAYCQLALTHGRYVFLLGFATCKRSTCAVLIYWKASIRFCFKAWNSFSAKLCDGVLLNFFVKFYRKVVTCLLQIYLRELIKDMVCVY